MKRQLTCIACPQGCLLQAEIENGQCMALSGNRCPKGADYGKQEIENPLRTLTTTVIAQGLEVRMVPVRTSHPIPKSRLMEAMATIRQLRLVRPVRVSEVIAKDFLGLGVDLIATRSISAEGTERRPQLKRARSPKRACPSP